MYLFSDRWPVMEVEFLKNNTRGPNKGETTIPANWKEYMYDIAFQKYVVQKANPTKKVLAYIVLADKTKSSTIDGLNQMFKIKRTGNKINIDIQNVTTKGPVKERILKT